MSFDLQDKVAVVTGGGSGIGREICKAFAKEGAHVVAADINRHGAEATVAMLEGKNPGLVAELDVGNAESWSALREQVNGAYRSIDVLCNNAGVLRVGAFTDSPIEDWYLQSRINIDGVILGCKTFVSDLISRGSGHIVNTASLSGVIAVPDCCTYTASKYAVVGFSQSLGYELANKGVQVSILCPGAIDTPMNDGVDFPAEDRLISASEVAGYVLDNVRAHDGSMYIFTHPEFRDMLDEQCKSIVNAYDVFNSTQA